MPLLLRYLWLEEHLSPTHSRCFYLPVFVKPVVDLGLNVKRVAEVGWAGRGHPEHGPVGSQDVVGQLLVFPVVVLLHDAEITLGGYKSSNERSRRGDDP